MAREVMIPLSAVTALINQQNEFNRTLVDLLGSYLEKASENYKDALNPPVDTGPDLPMHYSRMNEEEEDLQAALESGLIEAPQYSAAMKRLIGDTEINVEIPAT